MKISELQKILEHYKQENGDLEVSLTAETRFGEPRLGNCSPWVVPDWASKPPMLEPKGNCSPVRKEPGWFSF